MSFLMKRKPFTSQRSHSWSLTLRITGFNFGFFFTKIDDIKNLLTPSFLEFNPMLIILLANLASLALLSMSFVPTCRENNIRVVVYKSRNNIVVKLSTVCTTKWSKKGFSTAQFFVKIKTFNFLNLGVTNYKNFISKFEKIGIATVSRYWWGIIIP